MLRKSSFEPIGSFTSIYRAQKHIQLLVFEETNIIQLFHACLVNSQNYATRYRGQLNALLPEAARPRAIVH